MGGTHIAILTALGLEYDAVRAKLTGIRVQTHPAGTRFEVGYLGDKGCLVTLALTGKGNHPAAVLAERAIAEFAPAALVFAGVAGALQQRVVLGDVVVATHVYAYHGGTSQDDGLKARPRVWETSHEADQIARHVDRSGDWARELPPGSATPKVHFGPIAAGEIVHYSTVSDEARWIREQYNDALAVEMEAAGVAQAAHLNKSLPVLVVRGISDRADRSKIVTDAAGCWQLGGVATGGGCATALAEEIAVGQQNSRSPGAGTRWTDGNVDVGRTNTNIAVGHARVGIQAEQIFGDIRIAPEPESAADLAAQIADLRRRLRQARQAGQLDESAHLAAEAELDVATEALAAGTAEGRSKLVVALKRLRGLVSDVADLGAKLAAIISAVRGMS
jgi:adenosylhomocysteine nucleosidase